MTASLGGRYDLWPVKRSTDTLVHFLLCLTLSAWGYCTLNL